MDNNLTNNELLKNMDSQTAIIHHVHSRIYEILGYVSIIHHEAINEKIFESITRIEKLCKYLLIEMKDIVNYYEIPDKK